MTKKRIKILTSGAIRVKGFINGPVLTPYLEDLSTIFAMISSSSLNGICIHFFN